MENYILARSSDQWEENIAANNGHLLQSWAWGELKGQFGWTPLRIQLDGAVAQILFRHLPLGRTIAYVPKGPMVDWANLGQGQALFAAIHAEAQKRRAIFLKIEPDIWSADWSLHSGPNNRSADCNPHSKTATISFLEESGFTLGDTIQPQTSIVINIGGDEDFILAAMKQKTRYNIRLAERKGVVIRQGSETDIPLFYELSQLTSVRDGFGIHSLDYYQMAYRLFAPDHCALLIAEFEGEPLAALMAFCHGQDAYYFYGASSNTHRNLMPTYLIQWAAIRWAKSRGCTHYDLWGIPDADVATLEAEFHERSEGLWGVYRFKRGFGGEVVKSVEAYDYVYNPLLYRLYKLYRRLE